MCIYIYIWIYRYIYIRSICGQQLFRSLRANQRSLDQMKILKDQSAQTTATRAVGIAYRLWLSFSINRVLNLTKIRSIIYILYIYIYIYIYVFIYIYVYLYIYIYKFSQIQSF